MAYVLGDIVGVEFVRPQIRAGRSRDRNRGSGSFWPDDEQLSVFGDRVVPRRHYAHVHEQLKRRLFVVAGRCEAHRHNEMESGRVSHPSGVWQECDFARRSIVRTRFIRRVDWATAAGLQQAQFALRHSCFSHFSFVATFRDQSWDLHRGSVGTVISRSRPNLNFSFGKS